MPRNGRTFVALTAAALLAATLVAGRPGNAATADQKTAPEYYQAEADGQGTQRGKSANISVIIRAYSTPDDTQALLNAFQTKGMQGLNRVLSKMSGKGRLAITGTVGYDLTYVRSTRTDQGRTIRMLTDRPIIFSENFEGTGSTDFSISAVDLNLNDEASKSTGTLLPMCGFKLNKQNSMEIEAFQNPWTLHDIQKR